MGVLLRRGHSLLEVVIATGLIAICLPLFFNLVPISLKALRESERLRMCASLAERHLQECYYRELQPGLSLDVSERVDGEDFHIVREVYAVDSLRLDVVVEVRASQGRPFQLRTRVPRKSP